MTDKLKTQVGLVLLVFGIFLILVDIIDNLMASSGADKLDGMIMNLSGIAMIVFAILSLSGRMISKVGVRDLITIETVAAATQQPPRELEPEVLQKRIIQSREYRLPGQNAPDFNILENKIALTVTPCSDPMTPMYMLDNNYRIINWNTSFSICFDRTMEGRRGLNVLEWTYFLDNYQEVLDHGVKVFADPEKLPSIDIEILEYTSRLFGPIKGTKRAYQIPHDDGSCLGWLITIEPEFENIQLSQSFQAALFSSLRLSLMWSEYALSYDVVLNQSSIYPDLIQTVIGEGRPGPQPIPFNSKVLDLGAGTGNITYLLARPEAQRLVVAIDDNPVMLNHLRGKCAPYLREDAEGPGVITIKQDIISLYGLKDEFFDVVILNNVLYSLAEDAVKPCIREIFRVLKPGGEVRISEPHKKADAAKVLAVIKKELQKEGKFERIKDHYMKVEQINRFSLAPMLNKWDIGDMENILIDCGFNQICYREDKTYARQSFIICARRN